MNKAMSVIASLLAIALLGLFWTQYFQTGCWGLGGRTSHAIIICGIPGFFTGFVLSIIGGYTIWKWLRFSDW